MRSALFAAAFCALLSVSPALADGTTATPVVAELVGGNGKAVKLDAGARSGLAVIEQDVSFQSAKGQESGRYRGVLLWDLFKAEGMLDEAGHHGELRQVFSVTGADGYRIDFSVGEIAPEFGNRRIMLATEADGKPLDLPRVVVPGDKRGARSVRDVVRIEMR